MGIAWRILALLLPWMLAGCGPDYETIAAQRKQHALAGQGDIVFVAIEESWTENFLKGARLAVQEINARPGKLLGRTLRLETRQGSDKFDEVRGTVLDIAKDPAVTAVIGHRRSEVAIPASVIYEASRLIYVSPLSTGNDLTAHKFDFTFRMLPNNAMMAKQLASVAHQLGYKNIVTLYSMDYSRTELAFLFEEAVLEQGMHIVSRRAFNTEDEDYRNLISQFADKPIDLVFLSTDTKSGGRMLRQLREMGVSASVMGGTQLNLTGLDKEAGEAAERAIVPIFYNVDNRSTLNRQFIAAYRGLYGAAPDQFAANGYDSVRLVSSAVEQTHSTLPTLLSSFLHHMPYWEGVTGTHTFNVRGDVVGKKYFVQALIRGQWQRLPGIHWPYFLSHFDQIARLEPERKDLPAPFADAFARDLDKDRLRALQLDFLHELLHFGHLGMIYAEETPGKEPPSVTLARSLARKRKFKLETCGVALGTLDPPAVERRLLECYGSLSLRVDAMNIRGIKGVDREMLGRLQATLAEYKIPVLSLLDDSDLVENVAVRVKRLVDYSTGPPSQYIPLFEGLLKDTKVYQLLDRLKNLPALEVNLRLLNEYGLLRSSALLSLAPEGYLEWQPITYNFEPPQR
jgi:branched-chain amino acid transport system substrate-binding protein